jgi:hypothetical protein
LLTAPELAHQRTTAGDAFDDPAAELHLPAGLSHTRLSNAFAATAGRERCAGPAGAWPLIARTIAIGVARSLPAPIQSQISLATHQAWAALGIAEANCAGVSCREQGQEKTETEGQSNMWSPIHDLHS